MTIQIEIEEKLLAEVDKTISALNETREEAIREAMQDFLKKKKRELKAAQIYKVAYSHNPSDAEEQKDWEEIAYWEEQ
jgi:metal-responsive CopG/Arc/MetJ family transcriptional regulator